ncbi:MAG: hypothetical protein HY760_00530 [Nitrospirae bacterium]|nr:hypothetical protein [Nitrospirota bacterium]
MNPVKLWQSWREARKAKQILEEGTTMKPGWKTTEFWKTVITSVTMLAAAFGIIIPVDVDALVQAALVVGSAVVTVGYSISRGIAKRAS